MAEKKNYLKGTWAFNRETKFGDEVNISISDEGIEHLRSLPKDAKGNRKITLTKQKDPSKWSVYENTFIPKSNAGPNSESSNDIDLLPF